MAGLTGMDDGLANGYTINSTQVFEIADRTSVPGVKLQDSAPMNGGILHLDFDVAHDGGPSGRNCISAIRAC